MDDKLKVERDDENLGGAVMYILCCFAIFVGILYMSPNGAMLTIFPLLGFYMFKTAVTGRF
jgi:hypothetical protein